MANVSFKRGLQANLPSSNIVDGAFYLTTDTNRLYVGGANNKLELLNQAVKVYDKWDTIRAITNTAVEGQFYYAQEDNVLCTYSNGKWTQINPDHNDIVFVSNLNVTKTTDTTGETKKLAYQITLKQSQKDATSGEGATTEYGNDVIATFEIDSNDLTTIASDVSVALESNAIAGGNGFELKNSGGGANSSKTVQIKGGDNVSITRAEDGNITIAATDTNTTYELASPAGSTNIVLNGGDEGDAPSIELSGDDKITVKGDDVDKITFSHATSSAAGDYNATDISERKFKVPQFSVDATGHISNANLKEITLPEDKDTTYKIASIGVAASDGGKAGKGKLSISLVANEGEAVPTISAEDVLYHQITVDGTDYTKYNQESLGNFYSAGKVDELITKAAADMNAMTYKGIIDNDKFGAITDPQIGDTYKASADFSLNNKAVKTGDLIIYSAEGWDIVPSGDEIDSQFSLSLKKAEEKNTLVLKNDTSNEDAGVIEISGEKGITTTINGNKLTIAHASDSNVAGTVGTNENLAPDALGKIKVPSITYDENGHITEAKDVEITLPADKDTTYTIATEKSGTSNAAIKLKENGTTSGESPTAVFIAGTSIALDASENGITINHGTQGNSTGATYGDNTAGQAVYDAEFKVPKIERDTNGHITSISDVTIKMPSAQEIPTVTFSGETALDESDKNRVIFKSSLKVGDEGGLYEYDPSIGSSTLTLSHNGNAITMDLVWEDFT